MTASKAAPNQVYEKKSDFVMDMIISLLPRFSVAREGWLRSGLTLGLGLIAGWIGQKDSPNWLRRTLARLTKPLVGLGLLTAYAYRDPERLPIGNAPDYIYAPADGKVVSVQHVTHEETFLNGPAYRFDIASHLLDTPIERLPMGGRLQFRYSQPGQPAQLGLETAEGQKLLIVIQPNPHSLWQLPAPLADPQPFYWRSEAGQTLEPSAKIGVRGFGQPLLTSVFVPYDKVDVLCRIGQHAQAGMTVLGRLSPT